MKYYASHNKQLSLDLLRSSLEGLDKSNRWVSMGDLLPWRQKRDEILEGALSCPYRNMAHVDA